MSGKYILDADGNAVEEPDVLKWAAWFESANRTLALTTLPDGLVISTVFLGLDHNWGQGAPVLWETMVFCPLSESQGLLARALLDECQERYSSPEAARAGHQSIVERLQQVSA